MATIKLSVNILEPSKRLSKKLEKLKDNQYLFRQVCFDLIDLMTKRIHIDGNASDGSPIGAYNPGYLKRRVKYFKRTNDAKIVVSLTRQLENDWSVIATARGYGVGFKNPFNLKKARWVESIKDKKIFKLSSSENKYAFDSINFLVKKAIGD